jgi:hypothetical protein
VSVDEGALAGQVTIVKVRSEVVHLRHYLGTRILLDQNEVEHASCEVDVKHESMGTELDNTP